MHALRLRPPGLSVHATENLETCHRNSFLHDRRLVLYHQIPLFKLPIMQQSRLSQYHSAFHHTVYINSPSIALHPKAAGCLMFYRINNGMLPCC